MVIFVIGNFAKRYISLSGRCTKHQEPVTRSVLIRSIRYQKEKLNVCKRQKKKSILGPCKRSDTSAWKLLAPGYGLLKALDRSM